MVSRFPPARGRPVSFLVAALICVALASCSGVPMGAPAPQPPADRPPASQPATPGASVEEQLAQLAAGAAPTASAALSATPRPTRRATAAPARTGAARTPTPAGSLPVITRAQLPREARDTIRLFEQGGPFPYRQDGATFNNREGLLPRRPTGYYKEYTVITPGSPDRGARRIIAGGGGELYYTADHYDSFKQVAP